MKHIIFNIWILILGISNIGFGQDHGDHSHGPAVETTAETKIEKRTIENVSDKYEVLVKWNEIHANEVGELELYLSEYNTNIPIKGAKLTVSIKEDPSIKLTVDEHDLGLYHIDGSYPKEQDYNLVVNIKGSNGDDTILLSPLAIGHHEDETATAADHDHNHDHDHAHDHFYTSTWFLFLMGLLVGVLLMWLISKSRNRKQTFNTIFIIMICLSIPIPMSEIKAHGEPEGNAAAPTSNQFEIPKETQFLFEIQTQKNTDSNFSDAIKLHGTIVPSSQGKAEVSSPLIGKVSSLKVSVGQRVAVGQTLAIIEQYIDANTQVALASKTANDAATQSQRNALETELGAATKDYQRMKNIEDIAAKKEVDEATARYQKAKQNLDIYNKASLASQTKIDRYLTLKSPIAGIVDQFSITPGSTLTQGQNMFTITNLAKVYVEAQVFDKDIDKIKSAIKYTVTCTNSDHESSDVKLISKAQSINTTNQSQRYIFELSNPDGDFKIGEFVNLMAFTTVQQNTLAVPNSAINEINGKPVLFIKNKAEQYEIVYVSVGNNNGSQTIINKGLHNNERIVINGTYQMKMMFLNQ